MNETLCYDISDMCITHIELINTCDAYTRNSVAFKLTIVNLSEINI